MCLYPTLIKNPKYKSTKKNGGIIPPILDERVKYVPIGCQNCMECRKQKARSWQARLLSDIKNNTNGKFITFTFSNKEIAKLASQIEILEGYELDNAIATLATRRFLERWRKRYGKSLRHWLVTELGHQGTENIHIHGIIWTHEHLDTVEEIWNYGYMWKGKETNKFYKGEKHPLTNYVNEKTVNYVIKYILKQDEIHTQYKSKILTSPGIGSNYIKNPDAKLNQYNGTNTVETYRTRTGHKISMPIYWRNKIYTEAEREKLWLQRLDKNERWVCGEKIKVHTEKGQQEYYKLLEFHRKINRRLGYGDNIKNWDKEQYENERRKLMMEKRISNNQKTLKKVYPFSKPRNVRPLLIYKSIWAITENGLEQFCQIHEISLKCRIALDPG